MVSLPAPNPMYYKDSDNPAGTFTCNECFALVKESHKDSHTNWHITTIGRLNGALMSLVHSGDLALLSSKVDELRRKQSENQKRVPVVKKRSKPAQDKSGGSTAMVVP